MNNFNIIGKIKRINKQEKTVYITVCVKTSREQWDYIDVVSFSPEWITKYFKEGNWIGISGHIHSSSYMKNDRIIYKTDLIADRTFFTSDPTDEQIQQNAEFKGFI